MNSEPDQNWEDFLDRYYDRIYRYCFFFFGGNAADAEDATQVTFVKAWKSFGALRTREAEKAWVYSIARNTCLDRKRWWKRFLNFRDQLEVDSYTLPVGTVSPSLLRLIHELPARQREVFLLRHWHEFSTEETAGQLDISAGTVKSHLKRAVDTLRAKLLEADSPGMTTESDAEESSFIVNGVTNEQRK